MSSRLRVAGRGRLADGGLVIWSAAEGARGRRWRWAIDDFGIVRYTGLLELDDEGGFGRLELSGPAGLLTLHPEPDGSVHGNVVNDDGVRPVTIAGAAGHSLVIEGDPFGSALIRRSAGEGIRISSGFAVSAGPLPKHDRVLDLDVRGVPQLGEATEWPLELSETD